MTRLEIQARVRVIREELENRHKTGMTKLADADGIPAEAIFQAAKKIKGLKPRVEYPSIYENAEFVGTGDAQYSIEWESLDPNDHRNDR
jgi:hypothetical protein